MKKPKPYSLIIKIRRSDDSTSVFTERFVDASEMVLGMRKMADHIEKIECEKLAKAFLDFGEKKRQEKKTA